MNVIFQGNCSLSINFNAYRPSKGHLSKNEVPGKCSETFLRYGGSSSAETSLLALAKFDAVMTAVVDSLVEMINTAENCAIDNSQRPFPLFGDDRQETRNKGGTILQERIRRMKLILSAAVANLHSFCHAHFCKIFANSSEMRRAELSSKNSGSTK